MSALWGIQSLRGDLHVYPKRVSGSGGIYWLRDAKEVPDTQVVTYDYGDLMLHFELRSFAFDHLLHAGESRKSATDYYAAFYGTEGTLMAGNAGCKVYRRDGSIDPVIDAIPELHEKNWLDCMASRKRPNSDIEIGRLSTMLCHLGTVSYKLGRDVQFDGADEEFRRRSRGECDARQGISNALRPAPGLSASCSKCCCQPSVNLKD